MSPVACGCVASDTVERGAKEWSAARMELRRRMQGEALTVLPHHAHGGRVVADVLVGGVNVRRAMDVAGWSKRNCPRR